MNYYKPPEPWLRDRSKFLWYRWVVPKHLRSHFKKTEIRKSLGTPDRSEARRLILIEHAKTLEEVARAEGAETSARLERIDRAVDKFFALGAKNFGSMDECCRSLMMLMFLVEAATSANEAQAPFVSEALGIKIDPLIIGSDQPIDLSLALTQHRIFEQQDLTRGFALRETPARLLRARNWGPALQFIDVIVPMSGHRWPPGSTGYERAAELFLRRLAEHRFENWPANIDVALASHTAIGAERDLALIASIEGAGPRLPIQNTVHPGPQSINAGGQVAGEWSDRPLSSAFAHWERLARPGPTSVSDYRRTHERFVALYGDLPIGCITKSLVTEFRDFLSDMPKNLSVKQIKASGKDLRQAVEETRASDSWNKETRSPSTVKKDIGALSAILNAVVQDGKLRENVASGIRVSGYSKTKRSQVVVRLPLRESHFRTLFSSPLFTGCAGHKDILRTRPGEHVYQDELYWTFLFGVAAGPRLEEVGQVLLDDIEEFDFNGRTYAVIHVTGTGGAQSVKTDESIRAVVVHKRLMELGFLDYVHSRRKAGAKRLFDLRQTPSTGKWTKELSRRLNRYIDRVVTDDPRYVWYSTRHAFTDAARRAKIDSEMRRRMVGHAGTDVGEQYGLGYEVATIAEELDKIDLSFIDWRLMKDAAGRGR